jgi:ATP-dependent DNA helicase RecG
MAAQLSTNNSEPGIEPRKEKSGPQKAMEKLGLIRDIDLALHLPLRYEDETRITPLVNVRDGDTVQVEGIVTHCEVELRPRRQLVVRLQDDSDRRRELFLRFIHFYPSHLKTCAVGQRLRVRGDVRGGFFGLEMIHPTFKAVDDDAPLATALTPVYPASASLPQAYLRKAVSSGLKRADLSEVLPAAVLPAGSVGLRAALEFLHQPKPDVMLATLEDHSHPVWERLKFEELLAQQLSQLQAKRERARQRAPLFEATAGGLHEQLLAALPFSLTSAQRRVVEEIAEDLRRPAARVVGTQATSDTSDTCETQVLAIPMHRLLQGDVGSGKTVVAALAAAIVMGHGWQVALMAPTEILAEQHFAKLVVWLEPLLQPLGAGVAWLTGSRKGKGRTDTLARVASGQARLIIGTHAVIQDQVKFARLGLAIIDEQHRFGVQQRLALRDKLVASSPALHDRAATPLEPHMLMMSATPIPRTLAMTLFADLDVSTIDELPPGRTPIVTKVFSDGRRDDVVRTITQEVARGRQVYWVCPLIEEVEAGPDDSPALRQMLELKNVTDTHRELSELLPSNGVGLLHGRMNATDKAAAMASFSRGDTAVLVATTVIEVGVDVPNASLMVIEHAERFGLSQLHQLRGRVGRGSVASVCVLLYAGPLSDTGKSRLKAMVETNDGFEIARRDLEIRGPGQFFGARQSGAPLLRFADMTIDEDLVRQARAAALVMLDQYPEAADKHVSRWLGSKSDYMKA